MKATTFVLASIVLAIATTQAAYATLITIDANEFEVGTDVSQMGPGLTMQALTLTGSSAVTVFPAPAFFGGGSRLGAFTYSSPRLFHSCVNNLPPAHACAESWAVLELTFTDPVDFVSIGGGHPEDPIGLMAFSSAGDVITNCTNSGWAFELCHDSGGGNDQTLSISRPYGDITRVWFGAAWDGSGVFASSITYNSRQVPEPTSLSLFSLGLAVAGLMRRRRPTLS